MKLDIPIEVEDYLFKKGDNKSQEFKKDLEKIIMRLYLNRKAFELYGTPEGKKINDEGDADPDGSILDELLVIFNSYTRFHTPISRKIAKSLITSLVSNYKE